MAVAQLREWRNAGFRNSVEVVQMAEQNWTAIKMAGDEKWAIYEQVMTACLDLPNRQDLLKSCFEQLEARFPKSQRVERARAMILESEGRYAEALNLYESLLEAHPVDMHLLKRRIALNVAQDNTTKAIKLLNAYIETFSKDEEAWQQLLDLYLAALDYEKAAFCAEELLLLNPHSHYYHTLYAEILYTRGGRDNLLLARKYFAKAVSLQPKGVRALYGLYLACLRTQSGPAKGRNSAGDDDDEDAGLTLTDLSQGCRRQIKQAVEGAPEPVRAAVARFLQLS